MLGKKMCALVAVAMSYASGEVIPYSVTPNILSGLSKSELKLNDLVAGRKTQEPELKDLFGNVRHQQTSIEKSQRKPQAQARPIPSQTPPKRIVNTFFGPQVKKQVNKEQRAQANLNDLSKIQTNLRETARRPIRRYLEQEQRQVELPHVQIGQELGTQVQAAFHQLPHILPVRPQIRQEETIREPQVEPTHIGQELGAQVQSAFHQLPHIQPIRPQIRQEETIREPQVEPTHIGQELGAQVQSAFHQLPHILPVRPQIRQEETIREPQVEPTHVQIGQEQTQTIQNQQKSTMSSLHSHNEEHRDSALNNNQDTLVDLVEINNFSTQIILLNQLNPIFEKSLRLCKGKYRVKFNWSKLGSKEGELDVFFNNQLVGHFTASNDGVQESTVFVDVSACCDEQSKRVLKFRSIGESSLGINNIVFSI